MHKVRLREILLDPKLLVMNIVIRRVVTKEVLQRVEGKGKTTMIVDGLGGRDTKEDGGLSDRHGRGPMSDDGTQGIEDEAFEGMVVKCAKGVRTVETMMNRVNVLVKELVDVKGAVPEVLPGVDDKGSPEELEDG